MSRRSRHSPTDVRFGRHRPEGVQPLWRADGRELFFVSRDRAMVAVDVTPGATLETGPVGVVRDVAQPDVAGALLRRHA